MNSKSKDILEIIIYYVIAFALGVASLQFFTFSNDIVDFFVADFVMTIFIFICSVIKRNSSVYDAYWSVIPFYFVIGFICIYRLFDKFKLLIAFKFAFV